MQSMIDRLPLKLLMSLPDTMNRSCSIPSRSLSIFTILYRPTLPFALDLSTLLSDLLKTTSWPTLAMLSFILSLHSPKPQLC